MSNFVQYSESVPELCQALWIKDLQIIIMSAEKQVVRLVVEVHCLKYNNLYKIPFGLCDSGVV